MLADLIPMFLRMPLAILAVAAFLMLLWLAYGFLMRWDVAWKLLVAKYPPAYTHPIGKRYTRLSGSHLHDSASNKLNEFFTVDIAEEGLLVTAYFARRSPIFIPWSAIDDVEETPFVSQANITVQYDIGRSLTLRLPGIALAAIEQSVPEDLLRKSPFARLLLKRMRNQGIPSTSRLAP